jgi:hypothetical protein
MSLNQHRLINVIVKDGCATLLTVRLSSMQASLGIIYLKTSAKMMRGVEKHWS